jgi:hypothetical protein
MADSYSVGIDQERVLYSSERGYEDWRGARVRRSRKKEQSTSTFAFAVQSSPVQSFAGQPGESMKGDATGRDRKSSVMVADDKAGWAGLLAD